MNQIRNMVSAFEALKEDWESLKDIDNLERLMFRLKIFIESLEKLSDIFVNLEDKKGTTFYLNLKRLISEYYQNAEVGNRGLFHYTKDNVDEIFGDQYFYNLHDKYCRCNQKLHNLTL